MPDLHQFSRKLRYQTILPVTGSMRANNLHKVIVTRKTHTRDIFSRKSNVLSVTPLGQQVSMKQGGGIHCSPDSGSQALPCH